MGWSVDMQAAALAAALALAARVPRRLRLTHLARWSHARPALEQRGHKTRDEVFDEVSALLRGKLGEGAPDTIRESYEKIELMLPERERYPRTHDRWRR